MRVNINAQNVKTQTILNEIEQQTDYLFVYNSKEIDLDRKTSVAVENETVATVLSEIFNNTNVVYAMEGSNIFLMKKEEGGK